MVETDDRERLRQKLYAARKSIPELSGLAIVFHPLREDQLLIINKTRPPNVEDD